jgi:hypothetical protein
MPRSRIASSALLRQLSTGKFRRSNWLRGFVTAPNARLPDATRGVQKWVESHHQILYGLGGYGRLICLQTSDAIRR